MKLISMEYTERSRMIDQHCYDEFSKGLNPSELINSFSDSDDPISSAIDHITKPWDDIFDQPAPAWLKIRIKRYILANI